MEYINEITINDAVIHILDKNSTDPILNEYPLELDEDTYMFIYKHIEKCFKNENLKYAVFKEGNNIVKEYAQSYFTEKSEGLIKTSKIIARQLFASMNTKEEIPSADVIVAAIDTDIGPMIAILKMDYIKNFTHEIQFVEEKMQIGIVPQSAGLPGSGQRIQKAAFIKPLLENQKYDIMVLDKDSPNKNEDSSQDYFTGIFLNAEIITNERDMTRNFVKAAESWTRKNITDNAEKAEEVRNIVKAKLRNEDTINVEELSNELFKETPLVKEDFNNFVKSQGVGSEVSVDKTWVDKKFKRVRLNIDKQIDLYINEDTYHDKNRFEVVRNGDGSINLIVKNVINYIEK